MQVEALMTKDVMTCSPQDTLNKAAQIFWDCCCGCVPVVDPNSQVVGMLTDRDVSMAAYIQGRALRDIQVSTAMSDNPLSCSSEDTIATAENLMRDKTVRRLPVIDNDGRLVGLLSLNDIAREAARQRRNGKKEVSDAEVGETLSALCEAHYAKRAVAVS